MTDKSVKAFDILLKIIEKSIKKYAESVGKPIIRIGYEAFIETYGRETLLLDIKGKAAEFKRFILEENELYLLKIFTMSSDHATDEFQEIINSLLTNEEYISKRKKAQIWRCLKCIIKTL